MVKVGEDDVDALVLLAEEVLDGHLDVVKGDVCCASRGRVGGLDGLSLDTLAAFYEQNAEALVSLDAGDEVVTEDTVGDPLLGAIDNVVLAFRGLDRGSSETSDVRARKSLGDGQADLLLAAEDLVRDAILHGGVLAEVEDAGEADHHAGHVAVLETTAGSANLLLGTDHVVEVVEFLAVDGAVQKVDTVQVLTGTHSHVQHASLGHLVDQLLADVLAGALLLEGLRGDVEVGELTHRALEAPVAVLEVGRPELGSEPKGLGVWHGRQLSELGGEDRLLLAGNGADGEIGVLLEHLVPVQVVECGRGIFARYLSQNGLPARMGVEELGNIVDHRVDNKPHAILSVMFGDLLAGEGLGGGFQGHDGRLVAGVVGGYGRGGESGQGAPSTANMVPFAPEWKRNFEKPAVEEYKDEEEEGRKRGEEIRFRRRSYRNIVSTGNHAGPRAAFFRSLLASTLSLQVSTSALRCSALEP